jgi:hypothetical protein
MTDGEGAPAQPGLLYAPSQSPFPLVGSVITDENVREVAIPHVPPLAIGRMTFWPAAPSVGVDPPAVDPAWLDPDARSAVIARPMPDDLVKAPDLRGIGDPAGLA